MTTSFTHVLGDIHGLFKEANARVKFLPENSKVLCVGDTGIGFGKENILSSNIYSIRGNHCNPSEIKLWKNYVGDYGLYDNVFIVGGADSIDKQFRIPGVSWWADEQLSREEMELCLQLYKETKPDLVVTHDAPYFLYDNLIARSGSRHKFGGSATAYLLEEMFKHHQPARWFFDHWHIPFYKRVDKTDFVGLAELELRKL